MANTLEMEGLPVIDAKRPRIVEVSANDIKSGNTKDPGTCAIARACKRAMQATEARVYLTRTFLKIDGKWVRYRTPGSIRSEIIAFDRGGQFSPGSYTLSPMPDSLKLGSRRDKGPKKTKGKKKRAYHVTVDVRPHAPISGRPRAD